MLGEWLADRFPARHEKEDVFDFCKNYDHIYYCEVIVHPDGMIERIRPNHQGTLASIFCEMNGLNTKGNTWGAIPVRCDVIDFLCNETGCIAVWYEFARYPREVTAEQAQTLKVMYENEKIDFEFKGVSV